MLQIINHLTFTSVSTASESDHDDDDVRTENDETCRDVNHSSYASHGWIRCDFNAIDSFIKTGTLPVDGGRLLGRCTYIPNCDHHSTMPFGIEINVAHTHVIIMMSLMNVAKQCSNGNIHDD